MRILNLSLDGSVLSPESKTAKRIAGYGDIIDKYAVIALADKNTEIDLSEKVKAFGIKKGIKILGLLKLFKKAKKLLKQKKFDIITVQDQYYLALAGWFLARKFKIGLELQIHGLEKYSGLRKKIAKFVIPKAGAVRCVSQRLKKQLINEFKVDEKKITVVPIYVEIKNKESRHKIQDNKEKFIFLTVGRLTPVKNIGLQIRALSEVVKKYSNVELWIAGDGADRKKMENETVKLGIKNRIKFLGWQNNLEKFYLQADAFLLTSDYEGWGMAVVEAASFGLPIIMTDVGCAGEFIENEKSGLVIPVNNQAKLEEAMTKIINSDDLRKNLAEDALSAIKNLPSKEETLALYKQSWGKAFLHQ